MCERLLMWIVFKERLIVCVGRLVSSGCVYSMYSVVSKWWCKWWV